VHLPDAFEALGSAYGAITGRLRREAMRSRVLRVLGAWTAAAVFPHAFLSGLTASFFRVAMRPTVDPQEEVRVWFFICGDLAEDHVSVLTFVTSRSGHPWIRVPYRGMRSLSEHVSPA
jgi:hypothetical protein